MRKRIGTLVLAAAAVISLPGIAAADAGSLIPIQLNGQPVSLAGRIIDRQTFVPLREIGEKMNCAVDWDEASQSVTFTKGDKVLHLQIGNHDVTVNDHEIVLPSPSRVIDGRAYGPLRFIAENLGLQVQWDQANQTVAMTPIKENPITIATRKEFHDDGGVSVKIQYPQLTGMTDMTAQDRLNRQIKERIDAFKKDHMGELRAKAAELLNFGYRDTTMALECNYQVTYNQKELLSLFFRDDAYSGGPHGHTDVSALTINTATGQVYALPDLFRDSADLPVIKKALPEQIARSFAERNLDGAGVLQTQRFHLSAEGLVLFFQGGEGAESTPDGGAFLPVTIPYADLRPLLKVPL
ncbi:DUF4163 domain-containing protein [Heliobacterium gestii]|uniref:DUF4163 domain-containing protein n=1 Tax=Heliomicrobium gestii TaxID=2699 RepID=A0A845LJ37_HELGE|nr:stalk domain-containing protein [Heliomicrobium gestii]MBM7866328.1 hypothetical protein [Heliomicrobium gestii]MZP42886.1 DUF4163 domain-containing protein [Heliomicrobium gestii]